MNPRRSTEEQIIGVLREHGREDRRSRSEHGVSEATLCNWKAKYGMDVPEAKRLKQLEDENANLKKLLAEQMVDAGKSEQHFDEYRDRLMKTSFAC
jgi:putative transposase